MHRCNAITRIIESIQKRFPDYSNIEPATNYLTGRFYIDFLADKESREKMKTVKIPVELSCCPFCGAEFNKK